MSHPYATERIGADFYDALFASPTIGVALWDDKRRLSKGNDALARMFGRATEDEHAAQFMEHFASGEQSARFAALLDQVAATHGTRVFELGNVGDGVSSRGLGAALGARSRDGGICLFFDTGGRDTRARGHDLASRMAAIGILAAGVAHEINNPLAYAMGNLSFAIEQLSSLAPRMPELGIVVLALKDALEGTERVRRTVRNLKTFSRPDSDGRAPVDLDKVLGAAVSTARPEVQQRARVPAAVGAVPLLPEY